MGGGTSGSEQLGKWDPALESRTPPNPPGCSLVANGEEPSLAVGEIRQSTQGVNSDGAYGAEERSGGGPGKVRKSTTESERLTNENVDGIRFKPRQELSLEVDTLKVHIDSAENIKTIRGHDLL